MSVDTSIKILVVDDHLTMRRFITGALKSLGFENVESADDGSTALPILENGNFDLLVSDWNMPQMEGIDLLKKVRADDALKSIPFIMLTAEAKPEQIAAAAKAGVSDYMVKPFNAATLQKKIDKVFAKLQ